MPGHLNKERILDLFARLNQKLAVAGSTAEVYIVGGAVMALAHNAARVTEDVDSHIRRGREALRKSVREIAAEEPDLGPEWLNEAVTMRHLPEGTDPGERPMYSGSHLIVSGASIERMVAMKLHAGRDIDLQDLNTLLPEGGIERRQAAVATHGQCYGPEPMAPEADQYLIDRYIRRQKVPMGAPVRPTVPRSSPSDDNGQSRNR